MLDCHVMLRQNQVTASPSLKTKMGIFPLPKPPTRDRFSVSTPALSLYFIIIKIAHSVILYLFSIASISLPEILKLISTNVPGARCVLPTCVFISHLSKSNSFPHAKSTLTISTGFNPRFSKFASYVKIASGCDNELQVVRALANCKRTAYSYS